MSLSLAAALITLVELHGPDGQRFFVNPSEITTIREPVGKDKQHFVSGMRCVIEMSSGKFIPTHDTCDEVRDAVSKVQR